MSKRPLPRRRIWPGWRLPLALLAASVFAAPGSAAVGIDMATLMQRLASAEHPPRHFTEQRHSELLQGPITLQGTLSFEQGRLVKQIREPFAERFVVEGESLLIERADGEQRIALADYPPLLGFVTIFRAALQGDAATLQAHYQGSVSGSDEQWQLQLLPRDASVAVHLRSVTIEGDRQGIRRFLIVEQSGDRSTLELGDVAP